MNVNSSPFNKVTYSIQPYYVFLRTSIKKHKEFIKYALLNYLDKFFVFLIPLLIVYFFSDKEFYNSIEYIYSVAAIVGIFAEFGLRNYFMYAYKESTDKEALIDKVVKQFLFLFFLYVLASLLIVGISGYFFEIIHTLGYILVRVLFSLFISFYAVVYLLRNKASAIFLISLTINIFSVVLLVFAEAVFGKISLLLFFLSQLLLVLFIASIYVYRKIRVNWQELFKLIRNTLAYSWPIMLNMLLFMFVNNYGKIYAFNYLSTEDMYQLSFIQRASMLIQLTHASISGYLIKDIFVDENKQVNKKIFRLYSVLLIGVALLLMVVLAFLNNFKPEYKVEINLSGILIILYTLVWCFTGFFEVYINKINKNKMILVFSGISALLFILILIPGYFEPILNISLAMFVGMLVNLGLELYYLKSQGISVKL